MSEDKNVGGAPTKYKGKETDELVYRLALLGLTDKEIASVIGVCEKTINNWKHEYPSFLQSLKKGKVIADAEVAVSFYKRATGYEYEEVRKEKGESDKGFFRKEVITNKHVAPDTAASFIWLKNRQPQNWKDKRETENTNHNIDHEEREKILEEKIKEAKEKQNQTEQ